MIDYLEIKLIRLLIDYGYSDNEIYKAINIKRLDGQADEIKEFFDKPYPCQD